MARLQPPHAIIFRVLVGLSFQDEAVDVCPVCVTGSSLRRESSFHTLLAGNKEEGKVVIVFRVRSALAQFPSIILYIPIDSTSLHSVHNV